MKQHKNDFGAKKLSAQSKGLLQSGRSKFAFLAILFVTMTLSWRMAYGGDGIVTAVIDAGPLNSVVVKNDGTVWAWGRNAYGESGNTLVGASAVTNPVLTSLTLTNAVAVASGGLDSTPYYAHTLVLRSDGLVMAGGTNNFGQLGDGSTLTRTNFVTVTNLANIVAIAAGSYHSLALKMDGTVWGWGNNKSGQVGNGTNISPQLTPVQTTNLANVVGIAAGQNHSLALKADGTVWAWGTNDCGQLGDGTTTNRMVPVMATNLNNVVAISVGANFSLALKGDGTVWAWGTNGAGQIGIGNTTTPQKMPVQVTNLANVVAISAGALSSLALKSDGTVWAWGANEYGQIGNGKSSASQTTPAMVTNLTGVLSIAAGGHHSLALLADGSVQAWGDNTNYQVSSIAPKLSIISNSVTVAGMVGVELAVKKHTVIGKTDGTVWTFGINGYGQLGDGTTINRALPIRIRSLESMMAVFAGNSHSVGLRTDGSVWAWGWNEYGQLGDGTTVNRQIPVLVAGFSGAQAIAAGGQHTLGLKGDGTVWAWGANGYGQLGNGLNTNPTNVVQTVGVSGITMVAAGTVHSLALKTNGTVWAWGANSYGQLGDGTIFNQTNAVQATNVVGVTSVSCGGNFSMAISTNGTVWAWGANSYGQLGNGSRTNNLIPTTIAGLTNITSIKAGGNHVLALRSDGTVWAWGRNTYGQLGVGTTNDSLAPIQIAALAGVIALGVNDNDSFAILTNGVTLAWGEGQSGQLGNGNLTAYVTLPVDVSNFWQRQPSYSAYQQNSFATTGRFTRGTGSDPTYQSFIVAYNSQLGIALDNVGSTPSKYPSNQLPWFLKINSPEQWHYSAVPTNDPPTITNSGKVYFPFRNPIVAFGSQGGGSPLYINQPTTFVLHAGGRNETNSLTDDIIIQVYRKADFVAGQTNVTNFASINIPIPRIGASNSWSQFSANGYVKTVEAYGLKTDIRLLTGYDLADGRLPYGVNAESPYQVTHTASSTEFFYVVAVSGLIATNDPLNRFNFGITTNWFTLSPSGTNYARGWSTLYAIDFDESSPWRTTLIDKPQFYARPVPPAYLGTLPSELTNLMAQVTNQIDLSSGIYLATDQSPELRSHPILDNFVTQMKNDPIALANYVFNQIQMTDGIGWPQPGQPRLSSIDVDGVNRSALDTFLEGQGSPIEQCSLLIYMLRKAGFPAAYAYPTNNNIQMLTHAVSSMLHIQVNGAVNYFGQPYTTNTLLTVNYPWVVTSINGKTIHIFPWLKDTEIIEGFNVLDYLPAGYNSGLSWVKSYLYNDTNIVSDPLSNVPRILFPQFVQKSLLKYHPGLSLNDMGMQIRDRQHFYARWQDFPSPDVVNNPLQSVILDSLSSSVITNVSPSMTNIFDTVTIQVVSSVNTNHSVYTGTLRMADILNRRLLVFTNGNKLTLWLAAYRPGITNVSSFTNDSALLNAEMLQVTNTAADASLFVNIGYKRDRNLQSTFGSFDATGVFLSPNETYSIGQGTVAYEDYVILPPRQVFASTVAAICMHVGKVSQKMLDLQAQEYWQMEKVRAANTNAIISIQDSKGTAAYLMGLSYYKNFSDGQSVLGDLFKQQTVSTFAAGLAKLGFKGTKIQPSVDMFFVNTMTAASGSMRPDQGQDLYQSGYDYNCLWIAEGSAEEHNVINSFFSSTNAISSVQLLQVANKKASQTVSGMVQINSTNYNGLATTIPAGYTTTLGSQGTWGQTVGIISSGSFYVTFDPEAVAFITPAAMTNATGSYKGSGSLVISKLASAGLIDGNLNGGWGDNTSLFAPIVSGGYNVSLVGGGSTPLAFAAWPPPTGAYLSDTITWSDAASIGSSFSFTPFESTGYSAINALLYSSDIANDAAFNLSSSIGNPGEIASWQQFAAFISDPVNPLTGAFHIDATDISLSGPMPLQLRRNYSSQNLSDLNGFGHGWKNAYLPYLTVATNKTSLQTNIVIYAAEMDGSVLAYRQQNAPNTNLFIPLVQDNPTLNNNSGAGIGSTANLFNNRLVLVQSATNLIFQLAGADGSLRIFATNSFPLKGASNTISRLRPYLSSWQDNRGNSYKYFYGINSTNTDFGLLNRIESSNGNFLQLLYNTFGYITEAFTGDSRTIHYQYDNYGDLVQVTLPDASVINYAYETYTFTNGSTNYVDSNHLLIKEMKSGGHELDNFYDTQRRVLAQKSTVGTDLNTYTNAIFIYNNNFQLTNSFTNAISGNTVLTDVNNNNVRYDYTNGLITKVTDQLNQTVQQSWYADNAAAPGYPRSLSQSIDKRGLVTQYKYDSGGNATNVTLTGDLTGDGITNQQAVSSFIYNTNNQLLQVRDAVSNGVVIAYDTSYSYLPSTLTLFAGNAPVSTNLLVYTNFSEVITNGVVFYTNTAYGMLQRMIHAFGSADASTNDWIYDGRGFVSQQIQYTATGDHFANITNSFFFNSQGQLVQKTDQVGRSSQYQYDGLGRVTAKQIFDTGGLIPIYQEYSYYDENGNLTWLDGARSNPEDYIWRDYDGADRKTQETHWRSRAKADGSGVEAETGDNLYATTFFEYDMYSDLVRVTDSYGNFTRMSYDAIGQMIQKQHFGPNNLTPLSVESFAYEAGGAVSIYTNALGGVTYKTYTKMGKLEQQTNSDGSTLRFTYYLDGRPRREYLANGNYYETTYDDVNRMIRRTFSADSSYSETQVFDRRGNPIVVTNAIGAVFTAGYDGANRITQVSGPTTTATSAQQTTSYIYQNFGTQVTAVNLLGSSISQYDALGRATINTVYNTTLNQIAVTTTLYSPDFNSVTATLGSGSNVIATTIYTDTYGKTLLTQRSPSSGVTNYSLNTYDILENLVASRDELWQTNWFYYDPLNRLAGQILPDGATVNFGYNAMDSLTNRLMPGGLTWSANFDAANRILSEQLKGGSSINRQLTYQYYTSGPNVGLLQSKFDAGRNVTSGAAYDAYLRLATNSVIGFLPDQNQTLTYQYDRRGLVTNLNQITGVSPVTTAAVQRSYDGYGQMTEETVLINGSVQSDFTQNWQGTGHRSQLAQTEAGVGGLMAYSYRADGLLTNVWQAGQNYSFGYANNGLLNLRINPWRTLTTGQRDGEGRLLQVTNNLGGSSALVEALSWRADSTLGSYAATRSGTGAWNDSRNYLYNSRNQLTSEPVGISNSVTATYGYGFDANKLGVRTSAQLSGGLTNGWLATSQNNLGQITAESWHQSGLALRAGGSAVNAGSVSATLDSSAISTVLGNGRWYSDLMLSTGSHSLAATANYPVGQFAATATSTFSVVGTNSVMDYYDGAGYVTNRVFGSGKTQTLTWDGLGRLVSLNEMDTPTNGFNWLAIYDGLGRRLRTVQTPLVNGVTNSIAALTLDSYYDPLVEFQELAVAVNGQRTWKVMGPDLNGSYGGLNGVGGLEATISESDGAVTPVLNDFFGNVLATVSGTTASWNSVRVGGYGPVLGYQAPTLTAGTPLAETLLWRSRRVDPSGFYNLGARYYDPSAGRFLSPDPLGHAGSMDLYAAFNGDPVNHFDADGRFAAGSLNGAMQYGSELYASMGNGLDFVFGSLYEVAGGLTGTYNAGYAALNFGGGNQADGRYQFNYANGSDAYRMGSDFGYTAAEIGLQVGLFAATEGLGALAPAVNGARWLEEGNSMRMGGTLALREGGEGLATSGSLEAGASQTQQLEFGFGERMTTAENYLRSSGIQEGKIPSVMNGINFNNPVEVATLPTGKDLIQYRDTLQGPGAWFSDPGVPANKLGIYTGGLVTRDYSVIQPATALRSTAANTVDSWTLGEIGWRVNVQGGGLQYYIPPSQWVNLVGKIY